MLKIININQLIKGLLILAVSTPAFATEYSVHEVLQGNWWASWGDPVSTFTHASQQQVTLDGDHIFSGNTSSSVSVIGNVVNCLDCKFTHTLSNGDQIFSSHSLLPGNSFQVNADGSRVDNYYQGTITIIGGTGLFTGATGSGVFEAIDYGIYNIDTTGNFTSFNATGQWSLDIRYTVITSVPEPSLAIMLLMGVPIMTAARKKLVSA